MQNITFNAENIEFHIAVSDSGAYIDGGRIHALEIAKSPVANLKIKRLSDNREFELDSMCGFKKTKVFHYQTYTEIALLNPRGGEITDFTVLITIKPLKTRIVWNVAILNDNHGYSVLSASYPVLKIKGDVIAFLPKYGGIVETNIIQNGFSDKEIYPRGGAYTMQYFAFYKDNKGVYAAIHDGTGAVKEFSVNTDKEENTCEWIADFPAIGMGNGANAFELAGAMVWQALDGDWYDAANIYRAFVFDNAQWIPKVNQDGRMDTPKWFKEIPFWIMDWMPNCSGKEDEIPVNLRPANHEKTNEDDWYALPIQLQKALGVPIGYHLYNWHKIPFNNDYPHYFPAQDGAFEGVQKLKENNIYVMPYINARLWDTLDFENTDYMFSKVGKKWATKDACGNVYTQRFASYEKDGEKCRLAVMCPSSGVWKTQISSVLKRLFYELQVDAVYLDQIAASAPMLCQDGQHNHLPGGGNWWAASYNHMLKRYQIEKRENTALTSESNAETYLKTLDGYLTWLWVQSNSVPAFSRVYAGYAVFFGRNSDGPKKEDVLFFKHSIAQSLVYGQQLGWINADVVSDKHKLEFLKRMVQLRYQYTRFFNSGELLRPPVVTCDIEDALVAPAMRFKGPQVIRHVICGAWRLWDNTQTVMFAVNIANKTIHAALTINPAEYGEHIAVKEGGGKILSVEKTKERLEVRLEIEQNHYLVLKHW